ncbi:class I SAM-dependent methyltransferase [Clostridium ihumii]|uniref:class I SAM-dependent methyltransferase n=1 Tax=Clostridium ihumii TaxID=1470356 RepID=UPI00058D8F22|nr:class I SAM-dependent methyltransferase [Clostridium ihumii]
MTYLNERYLPIDFNEYWGELLKQEDGTYSQRMKDDNVERDFWKNFINKKHGYNQDASAKIVMNEIRNILSNYSINTILEIGPGWGNYTLDLASICSNITCVDISNDILNFINKIAKENNKSNISTVFSKFEDFSEDKNYDFIFGYSCFYRMRNLKDVFKKMNTLSNKLCMVGMGMGIVTDYYKEMETSLNLELTHNKKDYIHFANILYQMGIDANIKIIPLEKKIIYDTWDDVIKNETTRLIDKETVLKKHYDSINQVLKKYFKLNSDNKYEYTYKFRGSLVYWEPQEI